MPKCIMDFTAFGWSREFFRRVKEARGNFLGWFTMNGQLEFIKVEFISYDKIQEQAKINCRLFARTCAPRYIHVSYTYKYMAVCIYRAIRIFIRDKFPLKKPALFDKASGKFRASSSAQEAHLPSTKCYEPSTVVPQVSDKIAAWMKSYIFYSHRNERRKSNVWRARNDK